MISWWCHKMSLVDVTGLMFISLITPHSRDDACASESQGSRHFPVHLLTHAFVGLHYSVHPSSTMIQAFKVIIKHIWYTELIAALRNANRPWAVFIKTAGAGASKEIWERINRSALSGFRQLESLKCRRHKNRLTGAAFAKGKDKRLNWDKNNPYSEACH